MGVPERTKTGVLFGLGEKLVGSDGGEVVLGVVKPLGHIQIAGGYPKRRRTPSQDMMDDVLYFCVKGYFDALPASKAILVVCEKIISMVHL